jgi:membrane associated rhomboid family serine protease/tetratricopeptide (TPR) repeat protein
VTYELALISVVVGAGYWGAFFVRQQPHGTVTFGVMQLAAAGLAGLGLLGRKLDVAWLGVAGAIGLGAGACLLVIGPLARALARRAVAAERIGIAGRLFDLAELLTPGSGVAEEKALLRAMLEIREGRVEHTIEALTAAKQRAPRDAQLAIDERIAMLYLTAYRWRDAIAHAEAYLLAPPAGRSDVGPPSPPPDGEGSLRGALGIAPSVWVELLGAYGRVGDLEQAARMLARLEDVCLGRDDAGLWIHRARVMFLAMAGRVDAVRALVSPQRARNMSSAARTYWMAVAHDHSGDREAAAEGYAKARLRSRGRPRALIDQALARLAEPKRRELAALASDVIARVEAAPMPTQPRAAPRGARVTWLVAGVPVAVSAVTALTLGDTADIGVLTRAGALVHGVVASGEWWRVAACVFVHVGALHLALNTIGTLLLGRLVEELFGPARLIAIFGGAGLAGALASYLAAPVGIAAGSSGAVLGLLGAVFAEVTWHRARYRAVWKRGMWGMLVLITVVELGNGFLFPAIDQWAHAAGLAAGAVLGLALSPNARWSRLAGYLGRVLALGVVGAAVVAAVMVTRTSVADSLLGGTARVHVVDGVAITAPARWRALPGAVQQPEGIIVVRLAQTPRSQPATQIATWIAAEGQRAKQELSELAIAREPIITVPVGWQGTELEGATPEDAMGYRQRVRVVLCGRAFGDTVVVVAVELPESIAIATADAITALIASAGPS